MILDTYISQFPFTKGIGKMKTLSVLDALNEIKEGKYKKEVEKIRSGNKEVKKTLPTTAFHGLFDEIREKKYFIESSGLIIIDIDDVPEDEISEAKQDIMDSSNNILACMISPSGDGIKLLYYVLPELVNTDTYRQIGKQIANEYSVYGNVDYLSITDCLISTYDKDILINEDVEPAFVKIKLSEKIKSTLEPLDESKDLFDDAEDFFETVLSEDIEEKTNNNFHYIQVAILDLKKFGFEHPKNDLSFVIDYAESCFKSSSENKNRFNEVVEIAKDYVQTQHPYKFFSDEEEDEDIDFSKFVTSPPRKPNTKEVLSTEKSIEVLKTAENGFIDYEGFFDRVIEVAKEGNRVGKEVGLSNLANICRFAGSGIFTLTGIPGHGKAQSLNSKIYTPSGYILMRDVKVGDKVLTLGGSSAVSGVFPQGKKDIYKVTFSDGASAECCKEHIWSVFKNNIDLENLTLCEIETAMQKGRKIEIPLECAFFKEQKLSITPVLYAKKLLASKEPTHIESEYLYNTRRCRETLLLTLSQGEGGLISTNSLTFKDDLITLINSLGFVADVKKIKKVWKVKKNRTKGRFISKIEFLKTEEAQCIMIDDKSHLYFTDDFIITHNTEILDACLVDLARIHNEDSIICGFEQRPEEHLIKLMRKMIGTDITCPSFLANEDNKSILKKNYDFVTKHISHINTTKMGGNINTILEASAEHIQKSRSNGGNPRYMVLDPFNMLDIKVKASGHEKIEAMLRKITEFSHKMNILVFLVAHPFKMKKDEKTKKYEVPDFYSVKGSSAFFEMSYHGAVVYRTGYLPTDPVFFRVLKLKQNNLGVVGEQAYFLYDKASGRYIPIDEESNELSGDHYEKNWLNKVK